MPRVTIKTGVVAADGREEILTDYVCDSPGCPNPAEYLVGVLVELRCMCLVCRTHAAMLEDRKNRSSSS